MFLDHRTLVGTIGLMLTTAIIAAGSVVAGPDARAHGTGAAVGAR